LGIYGIQQQIRPLRKWVSSRSGTREIHPFLGLIEVENQLDKNV